jgi:hypothetical protein
MKKPLLVLAFFICFSQVFGQKMKPQETEVWEPEPVIVTPGEGTAPPSDAIVLFDGKDLNKWENHKDNSKDQEYPPVFNSSFNFF